MAILVKSAGRSLSAITTVLILRAGNMPNGRKTAKPVNRYWGLVFDLVPGTEVFLFAFFEFSGFGADKYSLVHVYSQIARPAMVGGH